LASIFLFSIHRSVRLAASLSALVGAVFALLRARNRPRKEG
jgi:hypothetical protein